MSDRFTHKFLVEEHFYETKDSTVRIEYRVYGLYHGSQCYEIKTRLTKKEKELPRKQVFHF